MNWIKMRHGLEDCPQVLAMARNLGTAKDLLIGKLYRFWSYADRHTDDGTLRHLSEEWLDEYFGMPGFADALVKVGWISIEEDGGSGWGGGITLIDYESHNGPTAKKRANDAKRQNAHRKNNSTKPDVSSERHAGVTKKRDKCHASSRPEKRREDKNNPPRVPPKTTRAKPKVSRPDDFTLTQAHLDYGQSKGITPATVRAEWEKFLAHADSKDSKYANWDRAFQSWLLRAKELNPNMPTAGPASEPAENFDPLNGEKAADPEEAKRVLAELRQTLSGSMGLKADKGA